MAPAAALLLALTLGADAQLETGLRLEASARRTHPPEISGEGGAIDLSATPRIGLRITDAETSFAVGYAPRFAELSVGKNRRAEHLHEGTARLQLAARPWVRLEAVAAGALGRTDLLTETLLTGGAATEGQPGAGAGTGGGTGTAAGTGSTAGTSSTTLLSTRRVAIERWRTGLTLELAPDRRTGVVLSAGAAQDGGTDAMSRTNYPVVREATATAELRWNATRIDQLGLRLSALDGRMASLRADGAWVSGMAIWRHALSTTLHAAVGGGAIELRSRSPGPDAARRTSHRRLAPAAEVSLSRGGAADETTGQLVGTLGATIDRFSGETTQAAAIRAGLRWPWTRAVALMLNGSGNLSWTSRTRLRTGQVGGGVSFTLAPWLHLELTGSGTWQRTSDSSVAPFDSYAGTVRLLLDPRPLPF